MISEAESPKQFALAGDRSARANFLVPAGIAFASGIAWAGSKYCWPETILWPAAGTVALGLLLSCPTKAKPAPTRRTWLFLLTFFFLIGAVHAGPALKPPDRPDHIYNLIAHRQTAAVSGCLTQSPATVGSGAELKTRLLLTAELLYKPDGTAAPANGLVRLTLKGPPPAGLGPGDRLLARATLTRVQSHATPGVFNYQKFLGAQSIWITGWINSPVNVIKLQTLGHSDFRQTLRYYRYGPERLRHHIAGFLNQTVAEETRGLYKAILIGDRSEVSPATLEKFKAAGCVHILAISGMHMGLLALLFIGAFNWLLKRSTAVILHIPVLKTASLLALLPLTGYALIAGFNTPVVRALIMAACLVLALLFDRDRSLFTNIAIAAFVILLWQPASFFTVAFQLSFSAVIAIAVIYPRLCGLLQSAPQPEAAVTAPATTPHIILTKIFKWSLAGIAISIAALLGTAPLLVYNFNRLSLVSPLAGLLVEPLICFWSLIIGLIACPFIPFFPGLAGQLLQAGSWGLRGAELITAKFAGLPFASLWLTTPSFMEITLYFLILAGLLYGPRLKAGRLQYLLLPALAILLATPALHRLGKSWSADSTINVLEIGQGSAVLLELPHNRTILLDGGGPASAQFNVGEGIIAPYLWKKRLRRLDQVVISHPHADHYNGLFFILKRFRPKELWINGQDHAEPDYQRLLALAAQLGIALKIPQAGTTIFEEGRVMLKCLANPTRNRALLAKAAGAEFQPDTNDLSLVLKLVHRGKNSESISFLFPGDIGKKAEERLRKEDLAVDVLLAPHHGSASSNSPDFLTAASPRYVVVSAGSFRPAQFPAPALKNFCERTGITMLTTAADGTISFTTNGEELSVSEAGSPKS